MSLRWTVSVLRDDNGDPVRIREGQIEYDLFGVGDSPAAALENVRARAAAHRDKQAEAADQARDWYALIAATITLEPNHD